MQRSIVPQCLGFLLLVTAGGMDGCQIHPQFTLLIWAETHAYLSSCRIPREKSGLQAVSGVAV